MKIFLSKNGPRQNCSLEDLKIGSCHYEPKLVCKIKVSLLSWKQWHREWSITRPQFFNEIIWNLLLAMFQRYAFHCEKLPILWYILQYHFAATSLVSADSSRKFILLFLPKGNAIPQTTIENCLEYSMLKQICRRKTCLQNSWKDFQN